MGDESRGKMPELKEISLANIAALFSKQNARFEYFHGKLFSYIPTDATKCAEFLLGLRLSAAAFPNSHPATVLVGRLAPLVPHQTSELLAMQNGEMKLHFNISDLKLPERDYLAIISPAEKSEQGASYGQAFESINFIRSLISASFGKLPFYAWIADFDFDAKGQVALQSSAVRMPLYADLAATINLDRTNEICDRLGSQLPIVRQRLQRACNFYCMAMDQENSAFRFSSYWIALEILVGGKSDAIRTMLAKSYGHENKKFADESLFYSEIERVRHDLMHKGQFGGLLSYHERLLQTYFWDIVSHQIGLKPYFSMALVKDGSVEQERGDFVKRTTPAGAPTWFNAKSK
jgi:hypothetical protein